MQMAISKLVARNGTYFLLVFWVINAVSLYADINISIPENFSQRSCLTAVIQQAGISILLVSDEIPSEKLRTSISSDLNGSLTLICGDKYFWRQLNSNLYLVQKKNLECHILSMHFRDLFGLDSDKIAEYLLTKKIICVGDINIFPQKIDPQDLDFLEMLKQTKMKSSLMSLIKYDKEQERLLWRDIKSIPALNNAIETNNFPFWQLSISFFEPLKSKYSGLNIANGNSLVTCKLALLAGQKLEATIKNCTDQELYFPKFKQEGIIINDLASDGRFFEVNELGMFLMYPPLDSELPEALVLKPAEEKTFIFPLVGCRSRKNTGKQIWDIGIEQKYDYKPNSDCQILSRRNKNYNFYGIVVYFQDKNGVKYKAFNKEFVDNTGWPEAKEKSK